MILVTGGTGFLGSYLIRYLLKYGFQVKALRRPASDLSLLGEAAAKVQWATGDVLDISSLENAFDGVDKVYHAASVVSFAPSERKMMMKVNVEGTANVVNMALARQVRKLLYVSSSSALRKAGSDELIDEAAELEKNGLDTFYGVSKFLGETEVWRGIAEGLNAVIVNPAMLLGAGRWSDSSAQIFDAVAKGQLFYPTGATGYADVRDCARIMIQLMELPVSGERFIINAENRKFRDIIFEIADQLGCRRPPLPLEQWAIPAGRMLDWIRAKLTGSRKVFSSEVARLTSTTVGYSNQKIKAALNYQFIPISESIADTVRKYKESVAGKKSFALLDI